MADDDAAREVLDDARELIASGEWGKFTALVTALHPADLADLVLRLDEEQRHTVLDHLPTDVVGELFEYVEDDELRELIRSVGVEDLPAVLEEVDDDVAADVIQQLEPEEQLETLAALDRGDEVAELLRYGDESAGGIMSRGFVALNEDISVAQAIDYLRVLRPPAERAYYLYVVDRDHRLQGTVSIRDLLVSSPRTTLGEITQRDVHAVSTDDRPGRSGADIAALQPDGGTGHRRGRAARRRDDGGRPHRRPAGRGDRGHVPHGRPR